MKKRNVQASNVSDGVFGFLHFSNNVVTGGVFHV